MESNSPIPLSIAAILFAYSTIISWSYYGLKAFTYLVGANPIADMGFKIFFLVFVILGSSIELSSLVDLSDALVFIVAIPNLIVWAEGFGWASIQNSKRLNEETPMRLASVTKVLTAVAIMQLVERSVVSLDAPLTDYLPEFAIQSRFATSTITIRQILTHHAGLPSDLMQGFKLYSSEDSVPLNLLKQFRNLPAASKSLHLASEPGQVFIYSNLGFGLLGSVIERTTGQSYSDYILQNIISPLGMTNSAIIFPGHPSEVVYANGFTPEGEISHRYIRDISAGALASSATDMGQFGLSLFISPEHQEPTVLSHRGDGFPYHAALKMIANEDTLQSRKNVV